MFYRILSICIPIDILLYKDALHSTHWILSQIQYRYQMSFDFIVIVLLNIIVTTTTSLRMRSANDLKTLHFINSISDFPFTEFHMKKTIKTC